MIVKDKDMNDYIIKAIYSNIISVLYNGLFIEPVAVFLALSIQLSNPSHKMG
jgi:hypothetical protein